jgi:hypothetical protein
MIVTIIDATHILPVDATHILPVDATHILPVPQTEYVPDTGQLTLCRCLTEGNRKQYMWWGNGEKETAWKTQTQMGG